MTLSKETFVIDAHHPRESPDSTVSPDDRLKLVYATYKDDRFDNSTADPTTLTNIVFVHGTQMSKEIWEYMIGLFFNHFGRQLGTIAALDVVNHGDSHVLNKGKLGSTCSWSDGGKDIVKLLHTLNNVGPTILIGHSMGGAMCVYATIYEPGLIDSVIPIDPVLYFDPELFNNKHAISFVGKRFQKLEKFVRAEFKNRDDYNNYMNNVGISRTFHPKVRQDYIDSSAVDNADGTVSFKTSLIQQLVSYGSSQKTVRDLYFLLTAIDCEVLYVCGDIADWNPPDSGEKVVEKLRYGTLKIVPGGKHLVPFDMPDETFEAMKDFVAKRAKRGSELVQEALTRRTYNEQQRSEFVTNDYRRQINCLANGTRYVYSKL